ncbi:YARHG domain-containing protein [Reichenbachiella ulvae]|uniref:YARHG domain-containing protein n=1 Tax=Reichenbachiella ulvae TaxID=2980104 RepID=A0ABT3CW31_9BACT|nr:YARHG domain-containing protein [Reichenbachiella ulvae]MCV9387758.1 YARHG domain-containing protein [Reichenbachiella ulvae]
MKHYILLFVLLAPAVLWAQSTPDQQLIPEFVLKGKAEEELRLMRNEIFARYGYIFKSEKLTEYFSTKPWYSPKNSNVESKLTEVDKINIQRILKFEKLAQQQSQPALYENKSTVYHRITSDPETGDRLEKIKEVTFHSHCKLGTIKKTVERTIVGGEKVPTVVYAETSELNKPYWETTNYVNNLQFQCNYYQATTFGCCGAENFNQLYSYDSKTPFLTYNEKCFHVEIPNSKIKLFIGYSYADTEAEGQDIGKLHLATLDGNVNSVSFRVNNEKDKEGIIWYFTPQITISSSNPQNKINPSNNKIDLWGNNFAQSISEINDLTIHVEFINESTGQKTQADIPIIKGRLLGSDKNDVPFLIEF